VAAPYLDSRAHRAVPGRARPLHPGAPGTCACSIVRAGRQSFLHTQPDAVCSQPHAVSQSVSYAAHQPFAYADYFTHTHTHIQFVTIHRLAQPVTVSGIAHIQPTMIPAPPGNAAASC
jgi:hypothetical protein